MLPLSWLVGESFWWICVIQGFTGFAWAGFDITALNFAYDVMPEGKVTRYTSYGLFKGAAIFVGGLAGGIMLHVHCSARPSTLFSSLRALRLLLAFPLLFLLKEVRKVEHISYRDLMFKVISIGPRRGLQLLLIGRVNGKRTGHSRRRSPGRNRSLNAP